jgi:acyl-CoA-binding protein
LPLPLPPVIIDVLVDRRSNTMSSSSSKSSGSSSSLAVVAASAVVVVVSALAYHYQYLHVGDWSSTNKKRRHIKDADPLVTSATDTATSTATATATATATSHTPPDIPAPLQTRFDACAEIIKTQPPNSLSEAQQLQVYGLYKQATVGNCTLLEAPSRLNVVPYAKYKAWKSLSHNNNNSNDKNNNNNNRTGMDRMTAMQEYIDFTMLLEFTKEATDQADIVYPHDEDAEDAEEHVMDMAGMGLKPSTLINANFSTSIDDDDEPTTTRDLHMAARDNKPERLLELLSSSLPQSPTTTTPPPPMTTTTTTTTATTTTTPSATIDNNNDMNTINDMNHVLVTVNALDDAGQTALHLAADRGHPDCVRILLDHGADIFATDQDGISVFQAAVIAGHFETCRLLLERGADPDQPDVDGDTPRTCAQDDPELRELLLSQGLLDVDDDHNDDDDDASHHHHHPQEDHQDQQQDQQQQTMVGQQIQIDSSFGVVEDDGSVGDGDTDIDIDRDVMMDDDSVDDGDHTRYLDALDDIPIELDDDGDM